MAISKKTKIYVAGHRGLVGSGITRVLREAEYTNLVLRTSSELDLCDQQATAQFFAAEKPEWVVLAAAKVGGILANATYPADFIYQNLQIQNNVIHSAYLNGAKKLLFLGSSCIYPKSAPQPLKEEYLLTGPLEETNEPYSIAKITGIKMCQSYNRQYGTEFIAIMPTNLYGPHDNFDLLTSHVVPALIRKFHQGKVTSAPSVSVWGSGRPRRELLYVDDMARASLFLMERFQPTNQDNKLGNIFFNAGTGVDQTIAELATLISRIVGYTGKLVWDLSKPDGTPQKLQDVSRIQRLGWHHSVELEDGIEQTYRWFLEHVAQTL